MEAFSADMNGAINFKFSNNNQLEHISAGSFFVERRILNVIDVDSPVIPLLYIIVSGQSSRVFNRTL